MLQENFSRYTKAQTIMQGCHTNRMVLNDGLFPHWIDQTESFWYVREVCGGRQVRLVDASDGSNELAFDHKSLAIALEEVVGSSVDPLDLPISDLRITLSPMVLHFQCNGKYCSYDPENKQVEMECLKPVDSLLTSPDGRRQLFIRDYNLWVEDVSTGDSYAVTKDGTKYNSYGSSFLGFDKKIQSTWSWDSNRVLTLQYDTREVSSRTTMSYSMVNGVLKPSLNPLKLAVAGEEKVEQYRLVMVDIATQDVTKLSYPDISVAMLGGEFDGYFTAGMAWWSQDNRHVFFIDVTRGSKKVSVLKWDSFTGLTSVLFEENSATYVRMTDDYLGMPLFQVLPETEELIWYSERSGWAHLYLYDLDSGALKNAITEGEWLVRDILYVDVYNRELLLQTAARTSGVCPYYRDIVCVNIDTGEMQTICTGNVDHAVYKPKHTCVAVRSAFIIDYATDVNGISPCGQYIVTTSSRVDTLPESYLIDRGRHKEWCLEVADGVGLPDDWIWPEPFTIKAPDQETDLYGVVFRPPGFSLSKRYPVVDFLLSSRQLASIPVGSFNQDHMTGYFEMAALAALGFIVVGVVGRGTPNRDKQFQDYKYGKPGCDDDLLDHIYAIKRLAERHDYMDIDRVGVTSWEARENVVYAALKYSNFYKVTVSHCFMDPRFNLSVLEYSSGMLDADTRSKFGGPEDYVESLVGKLLLIFGPATIGSESSFCLSESLQKANKDFDMLCLPNLTSQITSFTRRTGWDYLVRYLQESEPPKEFSLTTWEDIHLERMGVIL